MSIRKMLACTVVLALGIGCAIAADAPRFGQPITEADVAPWDISIGPDGAGLPPGSGTPAQGAEVYAAHGCAACHGEKGSGGPAGPLVGGGPLTTPDREPRKLIGNYWPYATTIFDFIRRAMPWQSPKTLTNDEVYAVTAYILALNKIIGENDVISAETLPKVRMPNRDGFIARYPDKH
ncbi:MAG TPA: cytochrome c [Xanthobacteraceae bacterium]|jgi:cytochrome c